MLFIGCVLRLCLCFAFFLARPARSALSAPSSALPVLPSVFAILTTTRECEHAAGRLSRPRRARRRTWRLVHPLRARLRRPRRLRRADLRLLQRLRLSHPRPETTRRLVDCSRDANLMSYTMASLLCSQIKLNKAFVRTRGHESGQNNMPRFVQWNLLQSGHFENLVLPCTRNLSWEASLPYASAEDNTSIMAGTNVVKPIDTEGAPDIPIFHSGQDVVDVKKDPSVLRTAFKFPMWLLGPSVLLVTGIVPTLWLPLSSVFLGPNIAGLLSLVGLDCIFNLGAMLFFLMADAFGRPENNMFDLKRQLPVSYRLWNLAASTLGFVAPLALFFASRRGILQPQLPFIPFAVLLVPYLLLLSVQMLTEILTWRWKSPVWLVAPVVYEGYRVLQLMRSLQLADEISSPCWMVQSLRGLVSWWVLVLGIQLMRVAWFAGLSFARNSRYGVSDDVNQ